jgi:hypothetical protein
VPTRKEWRLAFAVGLFLFGPGVEGYLRQQAAAQRTIVWSKFYSGLADIVQEAGSDPDRALELADELYDQLWGRAKRKALPSGRAR